VIIGALLLCVPLSPLLYSQNKAPVPKGPNRSAQDGRTVFASTCAGCHGLDGRGSERAPDVASRREIQKLSDEELARIVHNGVPGTGMPAFHSLSDASVHAVVHYLRTLQGANAKIAVPGDPVQGKNLFFAGASCSHCHSIGGRGGFLAPDLSSYGVTHSVDEIRAAITGPAKNVNNRAKQVLAVTQSGQKFVGVVRNEDNFSLQIQDPEGAFHFLLKSDLEKWEYKPEVATGPYHQSQLSSRELNDIISFLVRSATPVKTGIRAEDND
jgi:putative heme-binding domain-containing protein